MCRLTACGREFPQLAFCYPLHGVACMHLCGSALFGAVVEQGLPALNLTCCFDRGYMLCSAA